MGYHKLMPWARKLTVFSVLIALIATVYALGAATPHEATASSHVQYVYSDWNAKPSGISGGDQFRLIFLSSTKRKATSLDIADYNTFVQDLAAGGHNAIRPYADGFNVVGCTASMPGFPQASTPATTRAPRHRSPDLLAERQQGSQQLR